MVLAGALTGASAALPCVLQSDPSHWYVHAAAAEYSGSLAGNVL